MSLCYKYYGHLVGAWVSYETIFFSHIFSFSYQFIIINKMWSLRNLTSFLRIICLSICYGKILLVLTLKKKHFVCSIKIWMQVAETDSTQNPSSVSNQRFQSKKNYSQITKWQFIFGPWKAMLSFLHKIIDLSKKKRPSLAQIREESVMRAGQNLIFVLFKGLDVARATRQGRCSELPLLPQR